MKQEKKIITGGLILAILALLIFSVPPVTGQNEKDTHPELSEQEMFIACVDNCTAGALVWRWDSSRYPRVTVPSQIVTHP